MSIGTRRVLQTAIYATARKSGRSPVLTGSFSDQPIGNERAQKLASNVRDWSAPAAIGSFHEQLRRALPKRVGLTTSRQ
jgi:hypothetical protein